MLASVWGIYLLVLTVADVHRTQKVFKVGEDQCFDEMCFAVTDARTMPAQTFDPSACHREHDLCHRGPRDQSFTRPHASGGRSSRAAV